MKFIPNNINAIIFDLGGVVLNLDIGKTVTAFAELSGFEIQEIEALATHELFTQFETGQISSEGFRSGLREMFSLSASDEILDEAWNAMLLDLPLQRLDLIKQLRPKYKTFVLSNTNSIHIKAFTSIVNKTTKGKDIESYFDKVYYSHKVHERKPNAAIFELVLQENTLQANATLFIDDTLEHIQAAKQLGLQTWHLTDPSELIDFLTHG